MRTNCGYLQSLNLAGSPQDLRTRGSGEGMLAVQTRGQLRRQARPVGVNQARRADTWLNVVSHANLYKYFAQIVDKKQQVWHLLTRGKKYTNEG